MAARITWRSRPRADFPYQWGCADKPLSEIEAGLSPAVAREYLGPFTYEAVVELLFRVKKIRGHGYYTKPADGGGTELVYIDEEQVSTCDDEAGVLAFVLAAQYNKKAFSFDAFAGWSYAMDKPVFKDEDGGYWLEAFIEFKQPNDGFIANWKANADDEAVDCNLTLACGVFPLKFYCGYLKGPPAEFAIDATEWWPYATKSGDPAWDVDTGEPINGGPGA